MPDAGITTDVIVGYPGETEDDHLQTEWLLKQVRFDKVHVAAYSPRPGTIAHRKMEDDVPADVKADRLHRVEAITERVAQELNDAYVGTTQTVLIEGTKNGQPFGRTRSGKLLHLDTPAREGTLIDAVVEHAGPFALRGSAVDAFALAEPS